MFSTDHSTVNPWRKQNDTCMNTSGRWNKEESRGLLEQESTGFTNYQSRQAVRAESKSITRGFLTKTVWQRIALLFIALGALLLVIRLSKPSPKISKNELMLADVPESPQKCADLGTVGSQILPWIQGISRKKLSPRSCSVSEAGTTLTCPITSLNSSLDDSEDSRSEPAISERRLMLTNPEEPSDDEVACEQIVNWIQGLEDIYTKVVSKATERVIRILDGTPEAVDMELVELQMFGVPQIQQFEKFKFHDGWFTTGEMKIEEFGGVAGFGFEVYCGLDLILVAGGGVAGGYSELEGFKAAWGGKIEIKDAVIGTNSSDLTTFYQHFEQTVTEIQNCMELSVLGGSSWGGGIVIDAKSYDLGSEQESFAIGPTPDTMTSFGKPEKAISFERWLRKSGGFAIPIKYSRVVSTKAK